MSHESKFNLRKLPFSPLKNPLVDGFVMKTKMKRVRTGGSKEMIDPRTGQVFQAVIVEEQELDEIHFVKVFTAGIKAAFNLTLTGSRVFQSILEIYQKEPLSGGFSDSIYLHFFDGGLSGMKIDISEKTFQRGLVELLNSGFLFPRGENLFWVNPNLFVRGDRAAFIKTYRRKERDSLNGDAKDRQALEEFGQKRLEV